MKVIKFWKNPVSLGTETVLGILRHWRLPQIFATFQLSFLIFVGLLVGNYTFIRLSKPLLLGKVTFLFCCSSFVTSLWKLSLASWLLGRYMKSLFSCFQELICYYLCVSRYHILWRGIIQAYINGLFFRISLKLQMQIFASNMNDMPDWYLNLLFTLWFRNQSFLIVLLKHLVERETFLQIMKFKISMITISR